MYKFLTAVMLISCVLALHSPAQSGPVLMNGGEWTSGNSQRKADMAIDPVCGMNVSIDKAAPTSKYKGMTYYFCSVKCKERFDNEPEKYLQDSGADRHNHP